MTLLAAVPPDETPDRPYTAARLPSGFPALVAAELARARAAHSPIPSLHEGAAVLLEELDEFWREVQRRDADRSPLALLAELIQVAAMAQRVAEDTLLRNAECGVRNDDAVIPLPSAEGGTRDG